MPQTDIRQHVATGRLYRLRRPVPQKLGEAVVPSSTFSSGVLFVTITTVTYTATSTDDVIICNSAIPIVINLPVASASRRRFIIKNINLGLVTLTPNGADTIDGEATIGIIQWESIQVVDYTANAWVII